MFVFVGILFVTYYVTKWIAGYQKTQGFNHNLEIIEAIRLTNNKYIQIVRAGKDIFYVIAIGKDEVTLLGQLTEDQLKEIDYNQAKALPQVDFKSILEKITNKK